MIRVNLLPYPYRPVRHSPIPYLLAILVLVAGVAGMVLLFGMKQREVIQARGELQVVENGLRELQAIINEHEQLKQLEEQLADKVAAIEDITRDRIIWSEQLYNLSRLLPSNMWYSDIRVETQTFMESRPFTDPQTKQQTMRRVQVEKPVLVIEGYATADDTGRYDINPLIAATEQDPEFASMFELEPPSFQDTQFDDFPVRKFTFEYVITQGDEPDEQ
jgi:Tfp pilus assembly protein PilN